VKIHKIRFFVKILAFLILVYGAYMGIRFRNFLPRATCTNSSNYSASCFLMPLQNLQFGLVNLNSIADGRGGIVSFPEYIHFLGKAWTYFLFFLGLLIFAIIFNKLWCGWACPFGIFQDSLTFIRNKIKIRELQLSDRIIERLSSGKYISFLLFYGLLVVAFFGFRGNLTPFFCRLCPAKSFLCIFQGNLMNLSIGSPPGLIWSILTCALAGFVLIGAFYKERFFCYFCPTPVLLNLFGKLSFLRFSKNAHKCNSCGKCWHCCPMRIKDVYLQKKGKDALKEDCILCLQCVKDCPKGALSIKYLGKEILTADQQENKAVK
jgi:ferredoxin-type protein NapH